MGSAAAPPAAAGAASPGNIIINEIAWMGTANSAANEWMELYNATQNPINLSGWTLISADRKLTIKLKGIIGTKGFYLLERTDNSSVPEVTADVIYKGDLSNAGKHLQLYDANKNLVDDADFSGGWTAGNNTSKQTAEKAINKTWQTSRDAGGTPKIENSAGVLKPPLPKTQKTDMKASVAIASLESGALPPESFSENLENSSSTNPWWLFLTALALTIVSAIIILLLKLKVFNKST